MLYALCLQAATLGNWFSGLLQRQDQLARWLTMGRPRAYWLTGFFNPQVNIYSNVLRTCLQDSQVLCDFTFTHGNEEEVAVWLCNVDSRVSAAVQSMLYCLLC
jgi:hypothetical protein